MMNTKIEFRSGRHTRVLEGDTREYVWGLAEYHPAVMPTEGFVYQGVFYGKAKSPLGWHPVDMPLDVLRQVL